MRALERRMGLDRDRLQSGLAFLQEHGLLGWHAPGGALRVRLTEARSRQLPVDDLAVGRARRRAEERLGDLLRYARSVTCRRRFLLAYFGEASPEHCGACDVCLGRHRPGVITPRDEPVMRHILRQVGQGVVRDAWFEAAPAPDHAVDGLVDWLVQEGYLRLTTPLEESFALTEKAHELMSQWKPREK